MSYHTNSFSIKEKTYKYYDLKSLDSEKVDRLPFTHKILLENALRHAENDHEGPKDVETILNWNPKSDQSTEISFTPSRVILQDFTGVPAVVDLATMRDAVVSMQGDPKDINPLSPAELVIDHSVQVLSLIHI